MAPVTANSLILLIASAATVAFLVNINYQKYHPESATSHRRLRELGPILDPKTVILKDIQLQGQGGQVNHPMCQLLPQVPDDLSWVKVPMEERGPQCSSYAAEGINLKRCCVGQCRKSPTIIRSDQPQYEDLFLKPDMPDLVSMPRMLEHLHHFVLQKELERRNGKTHRRTPPIDTCVLWYIGQSLTQDQASAAICKLTSLGYEIPDKQKCDIDDKDGLLSGTCELQSQSNPYCPKIRVRHYHHAWWSRTRNNYPDEAGPIIYNYGVHANSVMEFMAWMEDKFTDADFQAIKSYGAYRGQVGRYPFMWREHEPQHFATSDGTYGGQASKCEGSGVYNNYRNEAAFRFFERNGVLDKIPIIKSFNALRPLSAFHLGYGDCTHYCYSPWRFDLTWHGIALGLQTLPELQNACMQLHK